MRIKLCKSRYFWLTHNTWGQLYRVFFFLWTVELVMPGSLLICALSLCTPHFVKPSSPSGPLPHLSLTDFSLRHLLFTAFQAGSSAGAPWPTHTAGLCLPPSSYQISWHSDSCSSISFGWNWPAGQGSHWWIWWWDPPLCKQAPLQNTWLQQFCCFPSVPCREFLGFYSTLAKYIATCQLIISHRLDSSGFKNKTPNLAFPWLL